MLVISPKFRQTFAVFGMTHVVGCSKFWPNSCMQILLSEKKLSALLQPREKYISLVALSVFPIMFQGI